MIMLSVDSLGKITGGGMDGLYFSMPFYRKEGRNTKVKRLALLITKQISKTGLANHKPAQWFEKDWSQITDYRHNR